MRKAMYAATKDVRYCTNAGMDALIQVIEDTINDNEKHFLLADAAQLAREASNAAERAREAAIAAREASIEAREASVELFGD